MLETIVIAISLAAIAYFLYLVARLVFVLSQLGPRHRTPGQEQRLIQRVERRQRRHLRLRITVDGQHVFVHAGDTEVYQIDPDGESWLDGHAPAGPTWHDLARQTVTRAATRRLLPTATRRTLRAASAAMG